ncbi:MAG TPA: SAV_2336 N-terminal domain-related protein, partial [Ideonella sp.]|nr:SAV_2336 N-terminal domain-related protein [Ideonella sp.]
MIGELARRLLGAGLDATPDELGEILWLAQRLPAAGDAPARAIDGEPAAPPAVDGGADTAPVAPAGEPPPPLPAAPAPSPTPARSEAPVSLYATRMAGTIQASTLRVPGVAATGQPAELRRALQPFARRVASRWRSVLDEDDTAERAADSGVWCPVYRPLRERWFDLALVVEAGASMALWDEALADFVRTLRAHGGFRSIATHRWDDPAGLALSSADGRRRYPLSQIVRPDRRQLLLLVSDATSPRWRSGAAQALLRELGAATSVGVLQLLPRSVWRHTALGEPELTLYAERAGDPNHRLKALLPWWIDAQDAAGSLGVPVVGLEPAALGQWARSMTARGGAAVPGVLLAAPAPAAASMTPA